MKRGTYLWVSGLGALLLLATFTARGLAQDPVKVSPDKYKVLLENERVRVLEFRSKPGDKEAMHSHPDYVIYAFTPIKLKSRVPDGKTGMIEAKTGDVIWAPAVTHALENVGTTEGHALLIELKQPPKTK